MFEGLTHAGNAAAQALGSVQQNHQCNKHGAKAIDHKCDVLVALGLKQATTEKE